MASSAACLTLKRSITEMKMDMRTILLVDRGGFGETGLEDSGNEKFFFF